MIVDKFRSHILENHPRPDIAMPQWINLNGEWEFIFDRLDTGEGSRWFIREEFP